MKIIATNKIGIIENDLVDLCEKEFKKHSGILVLPKKELTDEELESYFALANTYNINVLGTTKKNNKEIPAIISKSSFQKVLKPNQPFKYSFDKKEMKDVLLKIGFKNMSFSYKTDFFNMLLLSSSKELSVNEFKKNMNKFSNNIEDNGLIIYSPLSETNRLIKDYDLLGLQAPGVYSSNLRKLGSVKDNYVVYNLEK